MDYDEDVQMGDFIQPPESSLDVDVQAVTSNGHSEHIDLLKNSTETRNMATRQPETTSQISLEGYLGDPLEPSNVGSNSLGAETVLDDVNGQAFLGASMMMQDDPPSVFNHEGMNLGQCHADSHTITAHYDDEEDIGAQSSSSTPSDKFIEAASRPSTAIPQIVIMRPPDPKLPYSSRRTGLVYDARMRFHTELYATEDDMHPEDPRRIWEIFSELQQAGLVEDYTNDVANGASTDVSHQRLLRLDARLAQRNEILLVHSLEHWNWVENLAQIPEHALSAMGRSMDSVYLHPMTHYCACLSAGGCIEATRAVVMGLVKNAIAVIRPPGHHAEHNGPGGFCFFNNVCVSARVCQNDFPDLCRKVLILDWDVHHGNGIQNVFYDDPNILYISLHVHRGGKFYPNGPAGDHLHIGGPNAQGKNINIPWPQHHMGDGDYLYAFQQIVMPVATEFAPDLVIIAAGFDAAEGDTLGLCHVSPEGFAHMTHMLMSLANGRVLAALEGGYNLRSIANSAVAITKTLMGEPPGQIVDAEPSFVGIATTKLVMGEQARFWRCLHPKETLESRLNRIGGERLHDVLRENQMLRWFREFGMAPLPINREKTSRSFDHQVLATDDFMEKKPLLIIFHDPPETTNIHNPNTSKLEPHQIIVTDVTQQYVKRAITEGFAVIDVNIPSYLTSVEVDAGNMEMDVAATQEVASYLWENYVEVNNPSDVFLLGIGSAAVGVIHLLNTHAEQTLLGVNRPADDYFPGWYYNVSSGRVAAHTVCLMLGQHSKVYVAENHSVWSPDRQKKLRKKYGRLVKSTSTILEDMLHEHQEQVFQKLAAETSHLREQSIGRSNQNMSHDSNPETSIIIESHKGLLPGEDNSTSGNTSSVGDDRTNDLGILDSILLQQTGSPDSTKDEITSTRRGTPKPGLSSQTESPLRSPLRSSIPPIGSFTAMVPDGIS